MRYQFFKCTDDDGLEPYDGVGYIDGYHIAERDLEDVYFKIEPDGDDIKVSINEDDAEYFSKFNEKKFLKLAKEYALTNDIFLAEPKSGEVDGLVLYDHSKSYTAQQAHFDCHPVTGESGLEKVSKPAGVVLIETKNFEDVLKSFINNKKV